MLNAAIQLYKEQNGEKKDKKLQLTTDKKLALRWGLIEHLPTEEPLSECVKLNSSLTTSSFLGKRNKQFMIRFIYKINH